jgi:hypothetical protein
LIIDSKAARDVFIAAIQGNKKSDPIKVAFANDIAISRQKNPLSQEKGP